MTLTAFKSYDVRGRLGVDLDTRVARRIGLALARVLEPETVVVGHDARESSPALVAAVNPKGDHAFGPDIAFVMEIVVHTTVPSYSITFTCDAAVFYDLPKDGKFSESR